MGSHCAAADSFLGVTLGVSLIVGGQFGSEGKGKVARWYADKMGAAAVVRVGGTNSGHTVIDDDGKPIVLRVLPTAAVDGEALCVLPAGSYVDVDILNQEIAVTGLSPSMIAIDPNAVIIGKDQIETEKRSGLRNSIGSTESGTGASVSMRVNRSRDLLFAKDVPSLSGLVCDTVNLMRGLLSKGDEIVVEGTQGFGLSSLHSPFYPYVTSRDTTAAGFLSEAGLSPLDVRGVVMVVRTFPIRVGGNSGPLTNETTWDEVSSSAGTGKHISEYTSVTKSLRRVARFDAEIVRRALSANNPSLLVLNHLDYIGGDDEPTARRNRSNFVSWVEEEIDRSVDYVGMSPESVDPVAVLA